MKKRGNNGSQGWIQSALQVYSLKTQSLQAAGLFFHSSIFSATHMVKPSATFSFARDHGGSPLPTLQNSHRTFKAFKQDPSHILLAHRDSWLPFSSLHRKRLRLLHVFLLFCFVSYFVQDDPIFTSFRAFMIILHTYTLLPQSPE